MSNYRKPKSRLWQDGRCEGWLDALYWLLHDSFFLTPENTERIKQRQAEVEKERKDNGK